MTYQPGWYDDPTGRHEKRYHDGTAWTDHVATGGKQATDAFGQAQPTGQQNPNMPEPWELVVMISAAVVLIGSFLPFLSFPSREFPTGLSAPSWNAWANALNLFPVTILVVLYAVGAGGHVALSRFTNAELPERPAGFSWTGLHLLLGALATITMLGYALRSWPGPEGSLDRGAGLFVMTIGAIGVLVGAVMEYVAQRDEQAAPASATAPVATVRPQATPGRLVILIAGAVLLIASFLTVATSDGESATAWQEPLRPLFLVPVVLGVTMAVHIALTTFANVNIPDRILGIEWSKAHLALGIHAALLMLGFLVGKFFFSVFGESIPEPDRDAGFWLMLLAAIALAVGAVVLDREPIAPPVAAAGQPPPPPPAGQPPPPAPAAQPPPPPPAAQPPPPPPAPPPDAPPAPGWWKASDGNWYPPEQEPGR